MKESQTTASVNINMIQEIRLADFLIEQLSQENDLLGIAITDRDGIPIAQEWSVDAKDLQSKFTHNTQIAAAFSNMSDQANKLGIGASDVFIASYEHYQIIQFNELQRHLCLVTLIVTASCNVGALIDKRETWRQICETVYRQVIRNTRDQPII